MAFDANAVYAGRNAIVYSAPFATTNDFPDTETIDWGEAWGAPWVHRGYTQDGVEWEISHDFADIEVDQELSPILTVPSGQTAIMRTSLAQFTPLNIKEATGQGSITDDPGTIGTEYAFSQYDLTGSISENLYSWAMDFKKNNTTLPMRAVVWRGRPQGSVTATFGVADQNARVPVEVRGFPDTSTVPSRVLSILDVKPMPTA